jgi:hypothetical protein
MPVSFLPNVQKQRYGRYTGEPTMAQLTKRPPAKSWWVQKLSADFTAD